MKLSVDDTPLAAYVEVMLDGVYLNDCTWADDEAGAVGRIQKIDGRWVEFISHGAVSILLRPVAPNWINALYTEKHSCK